MENQRLRFKDAPFMDLVPKTEITVGGAGGIGSYLSYYLTRIGYECYIYDDDSVEEHNLGGQMFKATQIGVKKVDAVLEICDEFSNSYPYVYPERITENTAIKPIAMACFDSMAARKTLFNKWKEDNKDNPNALFIDGRLSAEYFEIYCIKNTPEDIAFYEDPKVLFDDSEVEEPVCSYKQTSHFAGIIGGFITSMLNNHLSNIKFEDDEFRVVPRVFKHTGALFLTQTEMR